MKLDWLYDNDEGWSFRTNSKEYSMPEDIGYKFIASRNQCRIWSRQERPQYIVDIGLHDVALSYNSDGRTQILVNDLPSLLDLLAKYRL